MPGRRFATFTINIERPTKTNATGTLQKIVTYPTQVSSVEASIVELSNRKVDTALGDLPDIRAIVVIDADLLSGEEVRIGDRIKDTATGKTWTVENTNLVDGRLWECDVRRKIA